MKYELNKPYKFNVKGVSNKNGNLYFDVEINNNIFPVKAYPEQIENEIPSEVVCRIVKDENSDAYLLQDKDYLYPVLYKPDRKYLFEVIGIKDTFYELQDKYGLIHTLVKDNIVLSLNEVIIGQLKTNADKEEIVLSFYTNIVSPVLDKTKECIRNKVTMKPVERDKDVLEFIEANDWNGLQDYLSNRLKGKQIANIQQDVKKIIEKCHTATFYWKLVHFLVVYDAHIFLGVLAKAETSNIINLNTGFTSELIDEIIKNAFVVSDKLKFALQLLMPCISKLTSEQKKFIQVKCDKINNWESFYRLFKLLNFTPDEAVSYLLSLPENTVAAYTLYKFYSICKFNQQLQEGSSYSSFRPSKIWEYCCIMEKMKSEAFKAAAKLIRYVVLSDGPCPKLLLTKVEEENYKGFLSYVSRGHSPKARSI